MAKIELYTFSEVVKALEISSNELNEMILTEKIRPVRHQGRLKFKKLDVDSLKNSLPKKPVKPATAPVLVPSELAIPPSIAHPRTVSLDIFKEEKEFYSWEEAEREMQLSKSELEKLVSEQNLPVYEGANGLKFKIADVKEWKRREAERFLSGDNARITLPGGLLNLSSDETHASLDVSLPTFASGAGESQAEQPEEELCNFDQVLSILQMEMAALQRLIDDGELVAITKNGKMKLRKSEIEILRHERMLNATLMIEPGKIKVDEEDDIQPIVISAFSEAALPALEMPCELYSFDEAAYELQVESAELKRMIAHQQISPLRGEDGQLKFRKEDIKHCGRAIEPTLILPEEIDSKNEKTDLLPDITQGSSKNPGSDKSFYNFAEAAKLLKVTEQQISAWVNDGALRTYRNEGLRMIKKTDLLQLAEKLPPVVPAAESDRAVKETNKSGGEVAQYYKLEEVKALLHKEEKEIKIMVARGQLQISRSSQGYLFVRANVDSLAGKESGGEVAKKEIPKNKEASKKAADKSKNVLEPEEAYTPLPEENLDSYSVQEAAKVLNIGKTDIQRLVKEQKLQPLADGRFLRKDVDKLRQHKAVEVTMVLPLMGENIQEENEKVTFITVPQNIKSKNSSDKPATIKPVAVVSKPEASNPSQEMSENDLKKIYYNWREALIILQMEEEELQQLVQRKVFDCRNYNGKKWLKKTDVDQLKSGKMIEPTLIVGDDSAPNLLDDDDDDLFLQ
jgi:excisionase family DNA binding protein